MTKNDVEEWRPIPGYEGMYEASSHGRVRRLDQWITSKRGVYFCRKGRVLKPILNKPTPYYKVTLYNNVDGIKSARQIYVHQVVAYTFWGLCPACQEVQHLDGNPNNNSAANLAYGTQAENAQDNVRLGTAIRGSKSVLSLLTEEKVALARTLVTSGRSTPTQLAKKYHVSVTTMCDALNGKTWQHVSAPVTRPKHPRHLTEQDYEDIRRKYYKNRKLQRELAKEYGVSSPTISRIVSSGKDK